MPRIVITKNKFRKVSRNFSGECLLKQIPNHTYFKLVNKDGSLSKKTYFKEKGSYDKSYKDYCITNAEDICDFKNVKGSRKVSTRFIY